MPWTKIGSLVTAKAGANDVTLSFRREKANDDWVAYVTIDIEGDGKPPEVHGTLLGAAVSSGVLTDAERTEFVRLARKLRNAALVALGYTES